VEVIVPAEPQRKDWKDQQLSIPVSALLVAAATIFGGAGGSFLSDTHEKELNEIRLQLHDVQKELHDTNQRLEELSDLIDRAYPRSLPTAPR
jgi:hypothetical protein